MECHGPSASPPELRIRRKPFLEPLAHLQPESIPSVPAGSHNGNGHPAPTRSHRLIPSFRPLEIHLPQLVGRCPLKSLHRHCLPVLLPHQLVAQKNPMHRTSSHLDPFLAHPLLDLACSPIRPPAAQLDHSLLQGSRRLHRTQPRFPAVLLQPRQPLLPIPSQPHIPFGARYLKLSTQPSQGFLSPTRRHHEAYSLLPDLFHSPSHPSPLFRGFFPSPLAAEV